MRCAATGLERRTSRPATAGCRCHQRRQRPDPTPTHLGHQELSNRMLSLFNRGSVDTEAFSNGLRRARRELVVNGAEFLAGSRTLTLGWTSEPARERSNREWC